MLGVLSVPGAANGFGPMIGLCASVGPGAPGRSGGGEAGKIRVAGFDV